MKIAEYSVMNSVLEQVEKENRLEAHRISDYMTPIPAYKPEIKVKWSYLNIVAFIASMRP